MTIESIVELAYGHFIEQKYTGHQIRAFIQAHAMEELDLSEEDARALSFKEEPDKQDEIDITAYQEFYLWYYFNHMAPPELQKPQGEEGPARGPLPIGKREIIVYAIFRVIARVDDLQVDEAIHEWESECNYELASTDQLTVMETQFIGTTFAAPIM